MKNSGYYAWGARGREFESRHPDQQKAFFVADKKGFFYATSLS